MSAFCPCPVTPAAEVEPRGTMFAGVLQSSEGHIIGLRLTDEQPLQHKRSTLEYDRQLSES